MMLPECQMNEHVYAIPEFTGEKGHVEEFVEELKAFHAKFAECFSRSKPRENCFQDMIRRYVSQSTQ